ncbi:hypothetical protein EDB83DRAFT_2651894, partial [Lactarius deliciosus]
LIAVALIDQSDSYLASDSCNQCDALSVGPPPLPFFRSARCYKHIYCTDATPMPRMYKHRTVSHYGCQTPKTKSRSTHRRHALAKTKPAGGPELDDSLSLGAVPRYRTASNGVTCLPPICSLPQDLGNMSIHVSWTSRRVLVIFLVAACPFDVAPMRELRQFCDYICTPRVPCSESEFRTRFCQGNTMTSSPPRPNTQGQHSDRRGPEQKLELCAWRSFTSTMGNSSSNALQVPVHTTFLQFTWRRLNRNINDNNQHQQPRKDKETKRRIRAQLEDKAVATEKEWSHRIK